MSDITTRDTSARPYPFNFPDIAGHSTIVSGGSKSPIREMEPTQIRSLTNSILTKTDDEELTYNGINTLKNIEIVGRKFLVKLDLNVPFKKNENGDVGEILDYSKIKKAAETIKYLYENGATQITIISHLDRPKPGDQKPSLKKVYEALAEECGINITLVDSIEGKISDKQGIYGIENIRFFKGEKAENVLERIELAMNIKQFTEAEAMVVDSSGTLHNNTEASGCELVESFSHANKCMGFTVQSELTTIKEFSDLIEEGEQVAIMIGGAKDNKMKTIKEMVEKLPQNVILIVGGALANTFRLAQGKNIGDSTYIKSCVELAKEILDSGREIILSEKYLIAQKTELGNKKITYGLGFVCSSEEDIMNGCACCDAWGDSVLEIIETLKKRGVKSVLMNGTLGIYENPNFRKGTETFLLGTIKSGMNVIVCGGDANAATNAILSSLGMEKTPENVKQVVAGGAALDLTITKGKSVQVESLQN